MAFLDFEPPSRGFERLDETACRALLAQKCIGRVALTMGAIPVVLPVNYQCVEGSIALRTGEGGKLTAATQNAVVAFQVDEIDPVVHTGWSILAVGIARALTAPADLAWAETLPLRSWAPGSRERIVRLVPEFLDGLLITSEANGSHFWPWGDR